MLLGASSILLNKYMYVYTNAHALDSYIVRLWCNDIYAMRLG